MREIYRKQNEYYEPPSCVSHMPTDPDGEQADDDAENADFKGWRSLSSLLRRRGRGLSQVTQFLERLVCWRYLQIGAWVMKS